ncbi:alpha/beta fold hydrolase [Sulfitobacter sp. HNIBRBA3233]|uniref:alpha/beta hydrolase n=1 Tax=Sulfitobacter marinivivus TaxID=3158558 RepID=UPI0032DEF09D
MSRARRWPVRIILALVLLAGGLWAFGPYEPADLRTDFDDSVLDGGVSAYLSWREARVPDITPGVEKRVVWADGPETATEWAVVYLHGFSASSEEIRPVPDRVAEALGANLIYTRLRGHGRGGDAMAEGSVAAWMDDTAEALAIARHISNRTLVISTSTGGTLAAAAALDGALAEDVAGIVMVSPNFAINNPLAPLLTWPAARYWLPALAGDRRNFEPLNEAQAQYWTTEYPAAAVFPLAALVRAVRRLDLSRTDVPVLFVFSDADRVVDARATRAVMDDWGGAVARWTPQLTDADDPSRHVIAGNIVSPGQTAATVTRILDWAGGL